MAASASAACRTAARCCACPTASGPGRWPPAELTLALLEPVFAARRSTRFLSAWRRARSVAVAGTPCARAFARAGLAVDSMATGLGGAHLQYPAGRKPPRRRRPDRRGVTGALECRHGHEHRALRRAGARGRPRPLSGHAVRAGRTSRRAVCALCLQCRDRARARFGARADAGRDPPAMVARGAGRRARRRGGGASGGGGAARDARALPPSPRAARRADRCAHASISTTSRWRRWTISRAMRRDTQGDAAGAGGRHSGRR